MCFYETCWRIIVFCFNIVDWSIWSASDKNNQKEKPDIKHIPLMTRRRFSQLTSMVVKVGSDFVAKDEQVPIFFFSNFSEINKHYEMTKLILETGDTSPALFSFSTFNASAAQFSILNNNHSSVLAMSSIDKPLETVLIMAMAHLQTHNLDKALLLIGQEAVPEAYRQAAQSYYNEFDSLGVFCLSLLISKDNSPNGNSFKMTCCDNDDTCDSISNLLDFLETGKESVVLNGLQLERL